MNTIRYMPDGDLPFRPARKQSREKMTAYLAVQAADGIHSSAAVDREICHVKRLGIVVGILPPQTQQIPEWNLELLLGHTLSSSFP